MGKCVMTHGQIIEARALYKHSPELSRTIPNYPELCEIHPNGSERFRCHFVFLILAPRMDPRGPLTAHVTRLPALDGFGCDIYFSEDCEIQPKFLPAPFFGKTFCHDLCHSLSYFQTCFSSPKFYLKYLGLWQFTTHNLQLTSLVLQLFFLL